jgi:uncharacterized OB-fold protein
MNTETTMKNYHTLLKEHKLCAAACTTCNTLMLPPRPVCSNCGSTGTVWKSLSGKGKLRSFTVIHIAGEIYAEDAPYVVAIVGLEEGPSITGRLVGVDPLKPEKIHVGDPVKADFTEQLSFTSKESITKLIFRPA